MLGFQGPAQPSPALGDAINAGFVPDRHGPPARAARRGWPPTTVPVAVAGTARASAISLGLAVRVGRRAVLDQADQEVGVHRLGGGEQGEEVGRPVADVHPAGPVRGRPGLPARPPPTPATPGPAGSTARSFSPAGAGCRQKVCWQISPSSSPGPGSTARLLCWMNPRPGPSVIGPSWSRTAG